jgi:hypothetical protein
MCCHSRRHTLFVCFSGKCRVLAQVVERTVAQKALPPLRPTNRDSICSRQGANSRGRSTLVFALHVRRPTKIGTFLAIFEVGPRRALAQVDQMSAAPINEYSALDVLVVAQLSELRKWEAELQARLQSGAAVETVIVARELWCLQRSADRLGRMIDAM